MLRASEPGKQPSRANLPCQLQVFKHRTTPFGEHLCAHLLPYFSTDRRVCIHRDFGSRCFVVRNCDAAAIAVQPPHSAVASANHAFVENLTSCRSGKNDIRRPAVAVDENASRDHSN